LSPRQLRVGRTGRAAKPPPQLGQTLRNTVSTHLAQNVHSKLQIRASAESGGSAAAQCSQTGRICSMEILGWAGTARWLASRAPHESELARRFSTEVRRAPGPPRLFRVDTPMTCQAFLPAPPKSAELELLCELIPRTFETLGHNSPHEHQIPAQEPVVVGSRNRPIRVGATQHCLQRIAARAPRVRLAPQRPDRRVRRPPRGCGQDASRLARTRSESPCTAPLLHSPT